jgi:DNA-binding MarR family transcriptional regulator
VENRPHPTGPPPGVRAIAFLLSQLGAHAAGLFAKKIASLGLTPPQVGILRAISSRTGLSQQALAAWLNILPSRLVILVDDLEARGLVERRDHPDDRRVYALHVTDKGTRLMQEVGKIGKAHDDAVCAALSEKERDQLAGLLRRIADEQGLAPGVHPGFSWLPPASEPGGDAAPGGAASRRRRPPPR